MKAWITSHMKPLGLLAATIYVALKPEIFGGANWDLTQWLGFGMFGIGTWQAFAYANTTASVAKYTKETAVVLLAGMGALTQVLPNGISREDVSVLVAAVAAAVWSFVVPSAPKAVLPGAGQMGDSL